MGDTRWTEADVLRQQAKFGKVAQLSPDTVLLPASKPVAKAARRFDWADTLLQQIVLVGLPAPVRDYRFDQTRRFLMDLAWPHVLISCEVDGGEWTQGKHSRGLGMQSNCEKLNLALLAGWKPYRFTGSQVESGYALGIMEKALRVG